METTQQHLSTSQVAELARVPAWQIRRLFEDQTLDEPARISGRRIIPRRMLPKILDALRQRGWLQSEGASQ